MTYTVSGGALNSTQSNPILLPGDHEEILGRLEMGRKSGVLEHKSGNISETWKDRWKVTMEGL